MGDSEPLAERTVRRAWSAGRYPSLAPNLLPAIASLVNAVGVGQDDAVLDVGCGTGNLSLAAHRRGADVVGIDLTRAMLELAAESAALLDGPSVDWVEGDAQALPFADDTFDAVLSSFGHIFAPDVEAATAELVRVGAPGARVGFTAWSPDGVVGELADLLIGYLDTDDPEPWSYLRWGDPGYVRGRLTGLTSTAFERRIVRFRYASPAHFWRDVAEGSGPLSPIVRSIESPRRRARLREEALTVLEDWFADNAIRVEYLLVRGIVLRNEGP